MRYLEKAREALQTRSLAPFRVESQAVETIVGSVEWYREASDQEILGLMYEEYMALADNIDSFTKGMHPSDTEQHLILEVEKGGTRSFLTNDSVLGKYAQTAGRTFNHYYGQAEKTGDFTQCLALIANLSDPVLAQEFLKRINRPYESTDVSFARWGLTDLDDVADSFPDLRQWQYGRTRAVERYNRYVDITRNAFDSHARQEFMASLQPEMRRELHSDRTGILRALRIGIYVKRNTEGDAKKGVKVTEKFIKKAIEKIAAGPTVPEQLFKASLNALPLSTGAARVPVQG
jgi:hypothetical protein